MITFDINMDRLLEYGIIGIAILAFIGIFVVIGVTNRRGSIISYSQSKGSRIFCFLLAGFFLIVAMFYQTVKMFIISGALFLYAFGSPKILQQLQKESSSGNNKENAQQHFPDGSDRNSHNLVIQEDQRRRKLKRSLITLLRYVSWIVIVAAMIYGFFLIRIYQPVLGDNWTPVIILGVLFGCLAALFFANRMFNKLIK